jgi:hypothetical protein
MEVRLAAAEAIQGIARAGVLDVIQTLKESNTTLNICHVLFECRNLSEEEGVASVIYAINRWSFNPGSEAVKTPILPRLIKLLEDDNTDMAIAACRILRHLSGTGNFFMEDDEVFLRLTRLLSHPDIHVFVEAAWTASDFVDDDLGFFDSTVIQGLTRLLHHQDDEVVVKALRGLTNACDPLFLDILFEMASGGGIQQLIRLLSSKNIDIAAAALNFVCCCTSEYTSGYPYKAAERLFIHHGAIAALVRNITSSNPLLDETINALRRFPGPQVSAAIVGAGADKHLLHLLSASDVVPFTIIIIFGTFKDDDFLVFKDAGISQLLVPFARRVLDMPDSFHAHMMGLLADFILASESFREEFRAAGAESLIAGYLAGIHREHCLHHRLTKCLESLHADSDSDSESH